MPRVSHHFVADRPIDAVFDVVTTARFWPEWHPATRGVEGDIGHPARLGDQITEHVTIAGIQGSGTWTVVEHDRPHHLAMETDLAFGHLRISYQLTTVDGGRTRFQRDLDFPELGPQVSAAMQTQSAEGIASLARPVQRQVPRTEHLVNGFTDFLVKNRHYAVMASNDPAAKRDKLDAEVMAIRRRALTLLFGDNPTGAERLAFNAVFFLPECLPDVADVTDSELREALQTTMLRILRVPSGSRD